MERRCHYICYLLTIFVHLKLFKICAAAIALWNKDRTTNIIFVQLNLSVGNSLLWCVLQLLLINVKPKNYHKLGGFSKKKFSPMTNFMWLSLEWRARMDWKFFIVIHMVITQNQQQTLCIKKLISHLSLDQILFVYFNYYIIVTFIYFYF